MEKEIVVLNKLEKKFGKFQALKDVTFSVNKGEVLGFIGPNGAGKSTTIRVLLGMLKKSGGEATIFGKDVWKEDTARSTNNLPISPVMFICGLI